MPDVSNRIRRTDTTASNTAIDFRSLARLGAQARLEQIQAECKALLDEFPELRRTAPTVDGPRGSEIGNGRLTARGPGRGSEVGNGRSAALAAARSRRPMTAAEKKAVSIRMKKYWAERRKAKGA
jgi:hypothetical protein